MDDDGDGYETGLLSTMHRAYRPGRLAYEKEDLFTEYLAWLLNRSPRFRVAFVELAVDESADVNGELFREAEAHTQVNTKGRDRIDLVLDVDARTEDRTGNGNVVLAARLGIECKVDDRLREEQLLRYHEWLEEEDGRCQHVALAALTKKRLGQESPFEGDARPYWQDRFYWYEVAEELKRCVKEVQSKRLPYLDPEEDDFLESAGFVVIGKELRNLLTEEGMLPPTVIEPLADAELFREYRRYKDQRIDEILSQVENALDQADVEKLLKDETGGGELRRNHKKNRDKGRPISVVYHRDDPPAGFMFGVMISPPNRYVRRPGAPVEPAAPYEAELIAAFKMLDQSAGPLQVHGDLKPIVDTLKDAVADPDVKLFVPEDASYQKFVARTPVPALDDADEQVKEMSEFYRSFVLAFLESKGPDGQPLLDHLHDVHLEAVRER